MNRETLEETRRIEAAETLKTLARPRDSLGQPLGEAARDPERADDPVERAARLTGRALAVIVAAGLVVYALTSLL